ncbi:hypothetical protein QCA50_006554 [Cerrena zonata]|uniref:Uncharacterized protein n=1 Tax=Cerrena zonata TaxID=2478898 RepID=A0AAW0GFH1_9APHY
MGSPSANNAIVAFVPPESSDNVPDTSDSDSPERHLPIVFIVLPAILLGLLFLTLIASGIKLSARFRRWSLATGVSYLCRGSQERRTREELVLPVYTRRRPSLDITPPPPAYQSLYRDRPTSRESPSAFELAVLDPDRALTVTH